MNILKGIFYLLLLGVAIGFAIHNDHLVSLHYYFGWESLPLPLFLWAFLFLLVGLLISGGIAFSSKLSLRSRVRRLKKAIAGLEQKRQSLRGGRIQE
jgi:uncharacterized integral membrane protein